MPNRLPRGAFGVLASLTLLPLSPTLATVPYQTLVNSGPSSNRVDIVFVGDGYRQTDLDAGLYASHVQAMVDYMFSGAPDAYLFARYHNFFNVHMVNVVSVDNGADRGNYGTTRNTALDSTYFFDGVTERLLSVSTSKANAASSSALAGTGISPDMRFAAVNDTKYGGAGGTWATFAGGNASSTEIALHEVAHSFANVADEYFYTTPPYNSPYTGSEPTEPNSTKSPSTHKWDRWLGYNDPRTTAGPIGYYQGGRYYQFGLYRPTDNSKMRSLDRPFDAVTREAFIGSIYSSVHVLDAFFPTAGILDHPASLWVDTVDPAVVSVKWYVDNTLVSTGETLSLASLSLPDTLHTIRADAYDAILDHSLTGDTLDWWRLPNTAPLRQSITWTALVPEPATTLPLILLPLRRRR